MEYQIDILMATYNGEQYIEAQILSIISQTHKEWRLLIHDDGSTDGTVEIIRSFVKSDSRICLIEDGVHCGGAANNFLHLIRFSNAPFCMFCDQDDIWFDNKIEMLYNAIIKTPTDIPVVAYGRSYLWKPDKGILGITGWKYFPNKLQQFICCNGGIQGCSAIFNHTALCYMKNYNGRLAMHDYLLNMIVLTFGKALPVATPLMLYRQHSNNVTGVSLDSLPSYKRLWYNLRHVNPVIDRKHYDTVFDFFQIYEKEIDRDKCRDFEDYLAMLSYSRLRRIYTSILNGWSRNNSIFQLAVKILLHPYIN